jgi:MFS family permease
VSFLTGFSIAGRLGFGRLGDIFSKRYLMMVAVALQMIAYVVLLQTKDITMFYIYASLVGLGMGGLVPILSAIFAEYFGRTNYGAVYGLSTFLRWIGMAVGPTYAGWIFDTTGSYHIAFLTCIILAFIAIILLGWLKAPKRAEKD